MSPTSVVLNAGGAFGEVYKAMLKGVNPVAVKVLRDQSYTSREEFSREVALLKALHNSNIVQFQVRRPFIPFCYSPTS